MERLKYVRPAVIVLILTVLDQVSKYLAVTRLKFQSDYIFIDGLLSFTYHENRGAAFGILQGGRWVFVVFTVLLVGFICYYYISLPESRINSALKASLTIVLAGALGNFIDRFLNGFVVDFLQFEFINFPVFNLADVYVVCGTFAMGIFIVFFSKDENKPRYKAILNEKATGKNDE
ncbi:MAG: signal peptidase II [Clostridiales bacterium]|nr:signal peptidase II [Clostridiales bacterium]